MTSARDRPPDHDALAETVHAILQDSGGAISLWPAAGGSSDQLARYRVLGKLGEGGMGAILLVEDAEVGRQVAAKVLKGQTDEAGQAKFVREAQITGQLEHPNIVPMHELGMTETGELFFTMKRVEGRDLDRLLDEEPEVSLARLLDVFVKVCDAISFAHARGVVHRDLKPSNIMLGPFGEVLVMDWGLARVIGREDPVSDSCQLALSGGSGQLQTQDGTIVGTPAYMPPEQARGEVQAIDERSDVYSLGAILYELLCRRPPFEGASVWSVLEQVDDGALIPPRERAPERELPWELEAIVLRAMAHDPAARYATAAELRGDVEAWRDGRVLEAAEYSSWQLLLKWARRHRSAAIAAAAIALSLVAGIVATTQQMRLAQRNAAEAEGARQREAEQRLLAIERQQEAEARQADFDRLADVQLLRELRREADRLWPRRPERIAAYRDWLERAQRLLTRRQQHADFVARLRAEPELDPARRVLLTAMTSLGEDLAALSADDPHAVTVVGVRARLAFARQLRRRSVDDAELWRATIAAVARDPRYGGLALPRLPGLLPLGADPRSGLQEFAHLGSGAPPTRGADGQLQLREESGLVLVLIPAVTAPVGASRSQGPHRDPRAQPDESPIHRVALAAFLIGKHEVTQGQWLRATGTAPSTYRVGHQAGGASVDLLWPVTDVSWLMAERALARLGLTLPSEAQWEIAARAGSTTIWPSGDRVTDLQGHANLADRFAHRFVKQWAHEPTLDDGWLMQAPIGSFAANRWGLHDMIGNVSEWCRDGFHSYQRPARPGDGLREGPSPDPNLRAVRGGSCGVNAESCRVGDRGHAKAEFTHYQFGVRASMALPRPASD